MTDHQLANVLIGVWAILCSGFWTGLYFGKKRAIRNMNAHLRKERSARIQRWTPPAPQHSGAPGTPERLLSDYEDAIYAETRHAAFAQTGDADEQHHMTVAAQLHADVRHLRGQVLAGILISSAAGTQPTDM